MAARSPELTTSSGTPCRIGTLQNAARSAQKPQRSSIERDTGPIGTAKFNGGGCEIAK